MYLVIKVKGPQLPGLEPFITGPLKWWVSMCAHTHTLAQATGKHPHAWWPLHRTIPSTPPAPQPVHKAGMVEELWLKWLFKYFAYMFDCNSGTGVSVHLIKVGYSFFLNYFKVTVFKHLIIAILHWPTCNWWNTA